MGKEQTIGPKYEAWRIARRAALASGKTFTEPKPAVTS